ncbi:MAG: LptE family protein [Flavobacteriales bacterium]|jgi:hypothetical protein|tara:strand:- start:32030 stop:32527 length:498 start_codon:yes stop_codon:yes gene_type:complete
MKITSYFFLLFIVLQSCGIYSFTGASISSEINSVSVSNFSVLAPSSPPVLSNLLSETLKDKFNDETSLSIFSNNGDLQFEGEVTSYSLKPIAIQADETAAQNRLTITVKVKYTNTKDDEFNYHANFSRFRDYSSTQELSSVEQQLLEEIAQELVEDIFNKALTNW